MVTILGKSRDPCFICGEREKTVEVKMKSPKFAGALCMEHLYERLKDGEKDKDEE